MEPIYCKKFTLYGNDCDCFGRAKPATILGMMQEAAGEQCNGLSMSWDEMAEKVVRRCAFDVCNDVHYQKDRRGKREIYGGTPTLAC